MASSNGDLNFTTGDRWVVSSDSATTPTDPVDTSVLFGRRASVKTGAIIKTLAGVGCVTVTFSVHLAAGAAKYLLFFMEMNGSNNSGTRNAAKFNTVAAGSPLLRGISTRVQRKIANWDL